VIVTEWEQFRALDLDRIKRVMRERPALIDLRNIYPADELRRRGFIYESVGRPQVGTS
jgi:UDPglucose 6-dehydrogenase